MSFWTRCEWHGDAGRGRGPREGPNPRRWLTTARYHNPVAIASIFRDCVDGTARVTNGATDITVRFQKQAHNPLLLAGGFAKTDTKVAWLAGKRLHLVFG